MSFKNKPCEATTKAGNPCKSGAMAGEDYCGPHLKQHGSKKVVCSVEECNNEAVDVLCQVHLDEAYDLMDRDMRDDNPGMEIMHQEAQLANEEEEVVYITLTGHRPSKLGGYDPKAELNTKVFEALERKMTNAVSKFDNVVFRIGMAIGTDQMAAYICVKHGFTFDAYTPCEGQEKPWPKHVQDEYRKLLTHARNVYVTHEGPYPGAWCMQKRNEQMVDGIDGVQTNYLLSVYDGTAGGTANCVKYAQDKGIKVININPREL